MYPGPLEYTYFFFISTPFFQLSLGVLKFFPFSASDVLIFFPFSASNVLNHVLIYAKKFMLPIKLFLSKPLI